MHHRTPGRPARSPDPVDPPHPWALYIAAVVGAILASHWWPWGFA